MLRDRQHWFLQRGLLVLGSRRGAADPGDLLALWSRWADLLLGCYALHDGLLHPGGHGQCVLSLRWLRPGLLWHQWHRHLRRGLRVLGA